MKNESPGNSAKTGASGNSGGYSPVEGYKGGNVPFSNANPIWGSGGGGASQAGVDGTSTKAGNGGNGLTWNGSVYGGGGGAAGDSGSSRGTGGSGGGGAGASSGSAGNPGFNGSTNTGGGGGSGWNFTGRAASGGSGIVIITYVGTPVATGGTITQSGGNTFHTFTSSGTFTLN